MSLDLKKDSALKDKAGDNSSGKVFYYQKTVKEVVKEFKTSQNEGLTGKEAEKRLAKYGQNVISKEKKKSLILKFFSYFVDIFSLLLLVAAFISFLFGGEMGYRDALVITGIIFLNTIIEFIQEYKAEKIVEALRKILPRKAQILRDGKEIEVLASDIVPGDILILDEGDEIPADGRIISENELETNDFTLTGESVPQSKFAEVIKNKAVLTDIDNMVFAGTSVASGNAKVLVTATGMDTEFGKIACITQKIEDEPSPLQKELFKTGKIIARITVLIGILIFALNMLLGKPFSFSLVFALSLAVAMVPEGLPATVSISLALAVKKMAKRKALVKKLSAVETLGGATVICSDKTGTITKNEMTVKEIWTDFKDVHVQGVGYAPKGEFVLNGKRIAKSSAPLNELLEAGALCTNAKLIRPLENKDRWTILGDPTEGALITLAEKAKIYKKELEIGNKEIFEIPFTSERKRMTVVCKSKKGNFVYSKGAPLEVLSSCRYIKINGGIRDIKSYSEKIKNKVDEYAKKGLRILAIAKKEFKKGSKLLEKEIENDLIFLGLVCMIDPPKDGVKEAVMQAKKAGIRVIMITGDYSLTAGAVAERVGIAKENCYSVITGADLLKLKDDELGNILKSKDVIFARTTPEQKIRIVSLLQKQGEVVAVTGDGVNDAPALKKADIGVAMGIAGTDVSKEASDVILLDDNFKTIVAAVEEGRVVYDNLKKFVHYIFSSNVGELFAVITGVVLGVPLPLLAIQILAVDLGTDVLPSLALAVDPKDDDVMKRVPRSQNERLLNKKMILGFFFVGVVMGIGAALAFTFTIFSQGWRWGKVLADNVYFKATTITYASLVLSQIVNVLQTHAGKKSIIKSLFTNRYLFGAILSSLILLLFFMSFPVFQNFLGTRPIGFLGLFEALIVALFGLVFVKLRDSLKRRASLKAKV